MKWSTLLLFFLLISTVGFCQTDPDTLSDDYLLKGSKGTIYLRTGPKIPALIDYSTYTNILKATADVSLPDILSPNTIARFEFFDESRKRKRIFISHEFPYQSTDVDNSRQFFEILADGNGFLLLDRSCPVNVDQHARAKRVKPYFDRYHFSRYQTETPRYTQKAVVDSEQIDIICFLVNNNVEPYFQYQTRERNNISGTGLINNSNRTTKSIIDRDLPKKILGDKFQDVQKYARDNNLNWIDKDELALIVEHCKSIK